MRKWGRMYFIPTSDSDIASLMDYDSLKEAIGCASIGEQIFKVVKVGRINKAGKYIPIKRGKK